MTSTSTERPMPPLNADERMNLESWLDFYRATLAMKCEGLTEEQLRTASVSPSSLTLLGLVQHMAEVERNWFRRVLTGEDAPAIYGQPVGTEGHDEGFGLADDASFEAARNTWEDEITRARANCAARSLDDTSPFMGSEVSLRWIYTHMVGEYARHDGHADLIRERIDGSTGV
ncbi:DinB family protein [Streptomyces sp. NPDC090052]|uniref:DinB family protein n=1 Tax=unclassified Streptomyces TaxID=2593676 RepID=UPI002253CC36|nr:DinB family protein [Streptomyces sp. NBC_01306]MCX4725774.1 DinB family protein [Streptomyces sp. NBC_01306]WSV04867.1 DinB family protein [Streptomyces sp. NBC_01020]WSX42937.1 DinB family protein [Streptomyces sp. NBC_00963]WSX69051.1 DinB family protein [Streptomyces sp. NBC_00932]